jgi:hypothetical protein
MRLREEEGRKRGGAHTGEEKAVCLLPCVRLCYCEDYCWKLGVHEGVHITGERRFLFLLLGQRWGRPSSLEIPTAPTVAFRY